MKRLEKLPLHLLSKSQKNKLAKMLSPYWGDIVFHNSQKSSPQQCDEIQLSNINLNHISSNTWSSILEILDESNEEKKIKNPPTISKAKSEPSYMGELRRRLGLPEVDEKVKPEPSYMGELKRRLGLPTVDEKENFESGCTDEEVLSLITCLLKKTKTKRRKKIANVRRNTRKRIKKLKKGDDQVAKNLYDKRKHCFIRKYYEIITGELETFQKNIIGHTPGESLHDIKQKLICIEELL